MKKYIIKVTYLEGIHEGKSHFLSKGGYVVDKTDYVWQDSSYTLAACKATCTKMKKQNDLDVAIERRERERRAAAGRSVGTYPIYIASHFEPFEIETVDR